MLGLVGLDVRRRPHNHNEVIESGRYSEDFLVFDAGVVCCIFNVVSPSGYSLYENSDIKISSRRFFFRKLLQYQSSFLQRVEIG